MTYEIYKLMLGYLENAGHLGVGECKCHWSGHSYSLYSLTYLLTADNTLVTKRYKNQRKLPTIINTEDIVV